MEKGTLKNDIGRSEHCSDHCTVYALTDSNAGEFRRECNHQHYYECECCERPVGILTELKEMLHKVTCEGRTEG